MSQQRNKHKLLRFEIVTTGNDLCLRRNEIGSIFFLLFWAGIATAFFLLGLWLITHLTHPHDWMNILVVSPFVLGPLAMILFCCWAFPPQMITFICFKMDDRETWIRYLWFFPRTIRELPSKILITGGGSFSVSATLLFSERRARIPLFSTSKGIVNTHDQAVSLGMEQTTEIRELLKLNVETRKY